MYSYAIHEFVQKRVWNGMSDRNISDMKEDGL